MPTRESSMDRLRERMESSSIVAAATAVVLNDDLLACQILSRLPVKSLMRFKCVCKGWKSTIEHDSNFIDSHRARSESRPYLSISAVVGRELLLLAANLQKNRDNNGGVVMSSSIQSVKRIQLPSDKVQILGPVVEGMLCFVDRAGESVQMCNVSTGEVTPWVQSTAAKLKMRGSRRPQRHFGFDPRTGKHKAINVWSAWDFSSHQDIVLCCEVLTAGESRWRVIDDVPQRNPIELFVSGHANGSVYWFVLERGCGFELSEAMMAFDVGSEKFRMIRTPPSSDRLPCTGRLVEMDGCATLIVPYGSNGKVKMFKFEGGEDGWSEVDSITLPCGILEYLMEYHPLPGRDQMMILQSHVTRAPIGNQILTCPMLNVKFDNFYCYDVRSKSLSRFQIDGIPSSLLPDECTTTCSVFVENLLPLLPRNG